LKIYYLRHIHNNQYSGSYERTGERCRGIIIIIIYISGASLFRVANCLLFFVRPLWVLWLCG
jgi:hypothetical protein